MRSFCWFDSDLDFVQCSVIRYIVFKDKATLMKNQVRDHESWFLDYSPFFSFGALVLDVDVRRRILLPQRDGLARGHDGRRRRLRVSTSGVVSAPAPGPGHHLDLGTPQPAGQAEKPGAEK